MRSQQHFNQRFQSIGLNWPCLILRVTFTGPSRGIVSIFPLLLLRYQGQTDWQQTQPRFYFFSTPPILYQYIELLLIFFLGVLVYISLPLLLLFLYPPWAGLLSFTLMFFSFPAWYGHLSRTLESSCVTFLPQSPLLPQL